MTIRQRKYRPDNDKSKRAPVWQVAYPLIRISTNFWERFTPQEGKSTAHNSVLLDTDVFSCPLKITAATLKTFPSFSGFLKLPESFRQETL
jgi:hypothetical protein